MAHDTTQQHSRLGTPAVGTSEKGSNLSRVAVRTAAPAFQEPFHSTFRHGSGAKAKVLVCLLSGANPQAARFVCCEEQSKLEEHGALCFAYRSSHHCFETGAEILLYLL